MCVCTSLNPGTTAAPRASSTSLVVPCNDAISSRVPTATIRLPRTASACWNAPPLPGYTLPLRMIRSAGVGPPCARWPGKADWCTRTMTSAAQPTIVLMSTEEAPLGALPRLSWMASGQRQRDEFRGVILRADRHDDVLLASKHVGHRAARRSRRQLHLPNDLPRGLVIGAEFRSPSPVDTRRSDDRVAALAEEQESLGEEWRRAVGNTERRQIEIFQQRMIARTVAVGDHPRLRARVQVERGDAAVRTFDDRQSVDIE